MFQIFCLLFLAISPTALRAAIINVPADQPTIQTGINAANLGDTVLVAPGTYFENIDFNGKAITVISSGGAAKTIIDGRYLGPAVSFQTSEPRQAILNGFTIQHGGGGGGGSLTAIVPSIYVYQSLPSIVNNVITQSLCSGIFVASASPLIQGNNINNTQISNAGFTCNFFAGSGLILAGFFQNGSSPIQPIMVLGNTIEQNSYGSGIEATAGISIIQGNTIRNNFQPNYTGGGIFVDDAPTAIVQNLIYGNGACGGGDDVSFGVLNNAYYTGGYGSVSSLLQNNTIVQKVVSRNCSNVYPVGGTGSDVYVYSKSTPIALSNNVIVGSSNNSAVYCDPAGATPNLPNDVVFDYNDVTNTIGPAVGGNCFDESGTFGNISVDPAFLNPASNDFHLQAGSRAIDAGNNNTPPFSVTATIIHTTTDFDGNPRPVDSTSKGYPTIDMGAYEFSGLQDANPTSLDLTESFPETDFGPITFSTHLSSANGTPTGTVFFFENGLPIGAVPIDAQGNANFVVQNGAPFGLNSFYASYPGQGVFSPSVSIKLFCWFQIPVTVTLSSSLDPSIIHNPVTFTADVSALTINGTPTGSINFSDNGSPLASVPLSLSTTTGPNTITTASFTTSNLAAGTHTIIATYVPTGNFSFGSTPLVQTVLSGLPTTTTLAPATPNPADTLQPITLAASISTGTATIATGTITFFDGTTSLGTATPDATGHATFITSTLTTGAHTLHAVYSGDTSFATSTSNNIVETVTANPTFTTLSISPTQSQAFQFFTVTVSISSLTSVPFSPQSCTPVCTVTLTITGLPNNQNSTVTAPVLGSGSATFKYALAVGTYSFTATFNGSSAFATNTSRTASETVVPAATTLTLAASPTTANQNQSVAFTSVFTAPLSTEIPSGTITLLDGATPFATAPFTGNPLSNTATITAATSTLSAGTHIITASYPGGPNFLPATSAPITVIINPNDYALSTPTSHPIIPTEHYLAIAVNLSSIGVFADQVTLGCTGLPVWATCTFDQNTLQLTAGGTATTNLTIDTSSVSRYAARNQSPRRIANSIAFALTLPAGILGLFLTRRRRLPLRLTLFLLTTLAATLTLTGCTGMYPLATPPGAYTFNITARGTTTGLSHYITISLTVNP